jgi:hypothetical protein
MSTWGEIARRGQEATGPDDELNGAVALSIGWTFEKMKGDQRPYWRKPGSIQFYQRHNLPPYSSSLDAMLALIAEKLPERVVKLDNEDDGWGATIYHQVDGAAIRNGNWSVPIFDGEGKTPALSLLVAFSLAMEAEEASQGSTLKPEAVSL